MMTVPLSYKGGMWPYYPKLLGRAVPRYTSYPTAAEFHSGIGAEQAVTALRQLPKGQTASLYVHIPFCQEICWYCGCNTSRAHKSSRIQNYLEALEAEIHWLARQCAGNVQLHRISFGGGSPNAIEPLAFVRLVTQIQTLFASHHPDMSVELDPRSFTPAWAQMLGKLRVQRASLGVQTLEPKIMEAIGRIQPHPLIAETVQALRDNGVQSLNFDLMYGLPHQSWEDLKRTLDKALELRPDRIALFGYAHVPQVIPRQRRIDESALPDLKARFEMANYGFEYLQKAGMVPIGFDHFAVPSDPLCAASQSGHLRRNFQGFTDDQAEVLLGVGASSITSLPDLIYQNEKNMGRYAMRIQGGLTAASLGVERVAEDRLRGMLIEDILCGRPADVSALPMDTDWAVLLAPYLKLGLCTLEDDYLQILPQGLPYARVVASQFDRFRTLSNGRFSSAI